MDPETFMKLYDTLVKQQPVNKPKRKTREMSEEERLKIREQLEKNRLKGLETRRKKAEEKTLSLKPHEPTPTLAEKKPELDVSALRQEIYDRIMADLMPKTSSPSPSPSPASAPVAAVGAQPSKHLPLQPHSPPAPQQNTQAEDDSLLVPLRRRPRY